MWGNWAFGKRRGLRTWVLMMLQRAPKNGAEIIEAMEMMTQGWWRPSPGSVYPLLDELFQAGLIQKRADGRYELTATAREEIGWPFLGEFFGAHHRAVPSVEQAVTEVTGYVSYWEDLAQTKPDALAAYRSQLESLANRIARAARVPAPA